MKERMQVIQSQCEDMYEIQDEMAILCCVANYAIYTRGCIIVQKKPFSVSTCTYNLFLMLQINKKACKSEMFIKILILFNYFILPTAV